MFEFDYNRTKIGLATYAENLNAESTFRIFAFVIDCFKCLKRYPEHIPWYFQNLCEN